MYPKTEATGARAETGLVRKNIFVAIKIVIIVFPCPFQSTQKGQTQEGGCTSKGNDRASRSRDKVSKKNNFVPLEKYGMFFFFPRLHRRILRHREGTSPRKVTGAAKPTPLRKGAPPRVATEATGTEIRSKRSLFVPSNSVL